MGSENNMNDGTSFQQSDKPTLCANGCGFFGTEAMMNLCSKCYRDFRLKEEQAASAMAAVEKSMMRSVPAAPTLLVENNPAAAVVGSSTAAEPTIQPPEKAANRCMRCNKKVGLMGFKCKCGCTFCGSHRYPGQGHDCNFDYKGVGRDALAKANPVVKADKIQRF